MARPDKAAAVAELTDQFRSSQGAVLTEYRGLTVKQLQELRRALGENATYAVVKNTLTKIAAREAGVEGFDDLLAGPSAIAFIKGDPVETAKSLRDFARANSPLVIKGGILDGKLLTIGEISKIADLETREVILARLAGALVASLQNAVSLFSAPLAQVARLAAALQSEREQNEGPVEAAPADEAASSDAPADEAASSDAPADEAVSTDAPADEAASSPAAAGETATPEAPADEPAPSEAPADEPAPSEAPADETATPEAPADEPAPSEAPADETATPEA